MVKVRYSVVFLICYCTAASAQYNYGEVIAKSLLFYEANRSGKLPSSNRISWRGDSFLSDRGQNKEDLTGGYFDAGDFVKFGFPFASAMSMLAWGMVEFKDGYVKAGQWKTAKEALKWGMDYMVKIHQEPNALYVQVGDAKKDHDYWGRPEDWPSNDVRPTLRATTSKPASEVAAEQAAAMAAASEIFSGDGDKSYGGTLLRHATELYTFATKYRGKYSDSFKEVREYYASDGYGDEFLWAATWMYRVTKESKYKQDYEKWWTEFQLDYRPSEASWDLKLAQAQTLLAKVDGGKKYVDAARSFCDWVVDKAPKTPKGLVFLSEWGSLRHASNAVFVCLGAANAGINANKYRSFAKKQIDYMLGGSGRSFVCGYGTKSPQRPHHAAASCQDPPAKCDWSDYEKSEPNAHVLTGALVGGPDKNDKYKDDRKDFVANEVTLDYNAGFQSALAGLCNIHC